MEPEFETLFSILHKSGCAKKHTAAGMYVDGMFIYSVNSCSFEGAVCPRLNLPSGQGYELCQAKHAEATLASAGKTDGIVWLVGHYWACEPCAAALKAIGVKELRIREFSE